MDTAIEKSGRVTAYGFACGYVEKSSFNDRNCITLKKEHGVYFVVGFVNGEHIFHGFPNLTKARMEYRYQRARAKGNAAIDSHQQND